MPRPRLETPHVCSTPGCGAAFTRGGRVKPKPQCPRCYTRERRKLPAMSAPALPSVRLHVTLPVDVSQRLAVFIAEHPEVEGPSIVVGAAVLAFLDRAEAESARRTAQGKTR